jgi:hypothetical protein
MVLGFHQQVGHRALDAGVWGGRALRRVTRCRWHCGRSAAARHHAGSTGPARRSGCGRCLRIQRASVQRLKGEIRRRLAASWGGRQVFCMEFCSVMKGIKRVWKWREQRPRELEVRVSCEERMRGARRRHWQRREQWPRYAMEGLHSWWQKRRQWESELWLFLHEGLRFPSGTIFVVRMFLHVQCPEAETKKVWRGHPWKVHETETQLN